MKALIQEAIFTGKDAILHVLLFMTQFLKGLNGSLIRPYNPYVMRILRPLKSLYDLSSTDCNIKTEVRCINSSIIFEIDTLCEAIGIKIGEIFDIKDEANMSGQSREFVYDTKVDLPKEMPYIGYEVEHKQIGQVPEHSPHPQHMKYVYQIHLVSVLNTVNETNMVAKSQELTNLLTPISVKWFLVYLVNERVVKGGVLLKAFADIVACADQQFPCSLELAVSEILKTVKAIFRRLPACGMDEEKRKGLLYLGRSLRRLIALRNPSNFFDFNFNLKELLQQSKQYSQDVQAHVITFVSEYLNNEDDSASHSNSPHTIEELLEILNTKEKNFGEDALTRASSPEYCYIAFKKRRCMWELLENSLLQQTMPFIKSVYEMHKNYLNGVGECIRSSEKVVLSEIVKLLKRYMNKRFPKRSVFSDKEIQEIRKAVNAIVESHTSRILQCIHDTMPNFIYSELSKFKRDIDKSPGRILANSLTMQLLPACLAYFKVSTVAKAMENLWLGPHFVSKSSSSTKDYSQRDWKSALDICGLISKAIKLTYSNRPYSNAVSELRNIFEIIINAKPRTFNHIRRRVCHNLLVLFLKNFNSRATKERANIYLQVVKMLRILQCPFWTKETITNEWIQLVESETHERSQKKLQNSFIWNWEAIGELLEEGLISRPKLDNLLSLNIKAGNKRAVTLLLNLLDRFILPPIFGNKRDEDPIDRNQGANLSTYLAGGLFRVTHKRDFAVLNDFDLQKSTKALMNLQIFKLIHRQNFNLRLNFTCARIRALLDWDLLGAIVDDMLSEEYRLGAEEKDEPVEMKVFTKRAIFHWFNEYAERKQSDPSTFDGLFDEWMDSCNWTKTISELPKMAVFLRVCISLAFDNFKAISQFGDLIDLMITSSKRISNLIPVQKHLLGHMFGKLGRTLMQHHDDVSCEFNPRPYQIFLLKLFERLLMHFPAVVERDQSEKYCEIHRFIPIVFGHLLHQLRPCRVSKFAPGFMEILQNEFLMKCFCSMTNGHPIPVEKFKDSQKLYRMIYAQLLRDLTSHVILGKKCKLETRLINLWQKILNKYPDFICEFYHYFSKVTSVSKSILRNILAFARPSPSGCLLDELYEYTMKAEDRLPPLTRQSANSDIRSGRPAKSNLLDDYLSRYLTVSVLGRSPKFEEKEAAALQINMILYFEVALRQMRVSYGVLNNSKYYPGFLADLVIYLGLQAFWKAQLKIYRPDDPTAMALLPEMIFLESFLQHLHKDDQYILVCFLVGELRYKNLWTRIFSQCLLVLLRKSSDSNLKSMIIRVLIEYLQYGSFQSDGLLFVCCNIRRNLDFPELLKCFSNEERALFDNARKLCTNANC
nr:CCR4 NOT transcription complex subunit 1 [Hymenolepis microstoma]